MASSRTAAGLLLFSWVAACAATAIGAATVGAAKAPTTSFKTAAPADDGRFSTSVRPESSSPMSADDNGVGVGGDGDEESDQLRLYDIVESLQPRHRVKRPSVMGLDNYDEATTVLEMLRKAYLRNRMRTRAPSRRVIERILRILRIG